MFKTPIYTALLAYVEENNIRLHMPGHIGNPNNIVEELQMVAKIDITEVPGIDDLHSPAGAIKEAEILLAEAYKANSSMILVNGASSGIHAILLAVAEAGKKVLIPRNAHRSFYGGLVLSGLWPDYLPSEVEANTGIILSVTPDTVKAAIKQRDDIKGVFVTSPSYYGTTLEIQQMAAECHKHDIPLFIDEAHGSHFAFHESYPAPALWQGADAVVNGLHKTLPVLNQGACLHMASRMDENRVKAAMSLITTTSPSFPLLASIDLARALMQKSGQNLLENALHLSNECKNNISTIKGVRILSEELKDINGVFEIDPLKILVNVNDLSINGYEVASILHREYNIQIELQEESVILAMFSMFHELKDWEHFYYALEQIALRYNKGRPKMNRGVIPPLPSVVISPRQAYFSEKRMVKLEESLGLIAGEVVAAYPPGIPCLLPGELITGEIIDYLLYLRSNNIRIQGPRDQKLLTIDIIE
ncbi:MAG TPA: aminotransferase class I/II-fold pyridoxal phosphate-dependent enzyme [Syntrophomonadaceae bacterium]|nr:aminotransferase class I/II-fold pyridoxal phosphate-dependent enzyme [Syntrophomonadaceae bacterium]